MAAYLLTRLGGCSTRYDVENSVTVSVKPGRRRGGATGNRTKMINPMAPEMNMALRSSR